MITTMPETPSILTDRRHTSLVAAHVPLNAINQGGEFIFASATRPVCRTRYEAAANRSGCSRSAARVSRLPKGQFAPSPRGILCSPCQPILGGLHHEYSLAP